MTTKIQFSFILFTFLVCVACSNSTNEIIDTPTSGNVTIYIDETFEPIIENEKAVFESIYQEAHLQLKARPEANAFNAIIKDSARALIAARQLSAKEIAFFNSKKIFPQDVKIATDAVAIILNKDNTDSVFSIETLQNIFSGKYTKWNQVNTKSQLGNIQVIFDNTNSSTVRIIQDSVCKGEKLSSNLSALNKNLDVIDYVQKNKNAIGLIGISWISNSKDSTCLSFLKELKVAYVSRYTTATIDNSYQPFQAYIALNLYPLTRNIYFINCGAYNGLGKGFMSFLASQRGQKIIQKAGILPATMPLRIVKINNE